MFYLCFSETVVKKVLAYLFVTVAATVLVAVACTDYSSRLNELQKRIDNLADEYNLLSDNAESLQRLILALQNQDEMVTFAPISEGGVITGYKTIFKNAGEITLYNQNSPISVTEYNGRYYWTLNGFFLTDDAGNPIEIAPETQLPQFSMESGTLSISADGGKTWRTLKIAGEALITGVVEDAAKVVFTFLGGTTIVIPKPRALTVVLEGDDVTLAAGGTATVYYTVAGIDPESEEIHIELLCGDGWRYKVVPANGTSGRIEITAPDPVTAAPVILFAGDGQGRTVAVQMRLAIDASGTPDPPDPPTPDPILVPVRTTIDVTKEGGQIEAELFANVDYTVNTDAAWLQYLGTKAVRTDKLLFDVESNEDRARIATATISSGNYSTAITFRQEGTRYYLYLSSETLNLDREGGSATLYVSTNAPYTYTCDAGWITLTKIAGEVEDEDKIVLTFSGNATYEARTATLTITSERLGSRKVAIVQRGRYAEHVSHTCIPICHIMPCCRANNAGTKFLVNGSWNSNHDYQQIEDVRGILQNIKDAGINIVCIDFTNASQWDDFGQSALHNGDGGEFWYKFGPMLDNIVRVCAEKEMKYCLFLGNTQVSTTTLDYWNFIAGVVLERWASDPNYLHYGYGDDRPMLVMFVPGSRLASQLRNAPASQKNNLQQFHIGTCQINTPITPTTTDGWGYRNYSASSDGKVRFACPNSGVPPQDWARVDAAEWKSRMTWVLGATEYAVIGSYDDTCDAIFWGIADVRGSITECHRNASTEGDPFIYYNIVRDSLK